MKHKLEHKITQSSELVTVEVSTLDDYQKCVENMESLLKFGSAV